MARQQTLSMSASRTDPELEVHSVDDDKVSSKHGVPVKVKSIRLPNEVPYLSGLKITDDNAKSSTSGNGRISVNELSEKKSRCNDYGYDVTDSEDCGDSKIDIGYHFTWSDEDEPSFRDQKGFGLNVYESIRAISNEASKQIDAVLAVDLVDQLQEELKKLRAEVKRRKAEHSDLKGIVQMKDNQIGTLELERDLYKADTTNLANDLETCLLKLRRVGGISELLSVEKGMAPDPAETKVDERDDFDPSSPSDPLYMSFKPKNFDTQEEIVPNLQPLSPHQGSDTDSTASNKSYTAAPENTPPRLAAVLPIPNKLGPEPSMNEVAIIKNDLLVEAISNEVAKPIQRRKKVFLFALCRGSANAKKDVYKRTQRAPMETSDSATNSKTLDKTLVVKRDENHYNSELIHRPHGILRGQIQDMDQRLHLSIKTSEDLRRRMAMLHLYYENHAYHLDKRPVVENSKMHVASSTSNQQSSINQPSKASVPVLESRDHKPERDNQSLRKHRVVTFNV